MVQDEVFLCRDRFFCWQVFIKNTPKCTTVNNGETLIMMQMKGAFKELSKSKSFEMAIGDLSILVLKFCYNIADHVTKRNGHFGPY